MRKTLIDFQRHHGHFRARPRGDTGTAEPIGNGFGQSLQESCDIIRHPAIPYDHDLRRWQRLLDRGGGNRPLDLRQRIIGIH